MKKMIPTQNKIDKSRKLLYLHIVKPLVELEKFEFYDLNDIKKIRRSSIDEIYIGDVLDYLDDDNTLILLHDIHLKLRKGGKLYIQSNDSKCVAAALIYDNINSKIYKNIVFSYQKKNIFTLTEIKRIIGSIEGLKIDKCKFLNGVQYYIECQKK